MAWSIYLITTAPGHIRMTGLCPGMAVIKQEALDCKGGSNLQGFHRIVTYITVFGVYLNNERINLCNRKLKK